MRVRRPFDTDTYDEAAGPAPWVNGHPPTGVEGSVPMYESWTEPAQEIANVIDAILGDGSAGSGQDVADLTQLLSAIEKITGADGAGSLLATNGYHIFPSGLIVQWGSMTVGTASLPIVFPTAAFVAIASDNTDGSPNAVGASASNSQITTESVDAGTVHWIALGW